MKIATGLPAATARIIIVRNGLVPARNVSSVGRFLGLSMIFFRKPVPLFGIML